MVDTEHSSTEAETLRRMPTGCSSRISAIDICEVSVHEKDEFGLEFVATPDDLDRLIAESDYISLHLHLNEMTRHIIDERRLRLIKLFRVPDQRRTCSARG